MKKLILRVALVMTLTLVTIYAFAKEFSEFDALYRENQRIKDKTGELKNANDDLRKKIESLKNDKLYIEKVAREQLGMIKQGEKVYKFEE
jgi:cell division protein FtsB